MRAGGYFKRRAAVCLVCALGVRKLQLLAGASAPLSRREEPPKNPGDACKSLSKVVRAVAQELFYLKPRFLPRGGSGGALPGGRCCGLGSAVHSHICDTHFSSTASSAVCSVLFLWWFLMCVCVGGGGRTRRRE